MWQSPELLDDLVKELGDDVFYTCKMNASADEHGAHLFFDGFTVGQVVHDYGDVCQSIQLVLAVELEGVHQL